MSERITNRINTDCVELFPNSTLPMKVYRDESDIAYHMSENMWTLVTKLCEYETLEDKLKTKGIDLDEDYITSHIVSSVDDLSPEMLEAAYRKRKLEYLAKEACRQIDEQVFDKYPDTKAALKKATDVLAKRFINNYDGNLSDEANWNHVISHYIEYDLNE